MGVSFAKALAYGSGLPLAGVNHLEGHLWSGLHAVPSLLSTPFLALIVSGGHSELVMVNGFGDYVHLGGTQDDAAGEAFDKVAKLLGLGYPGGPEIERLAREANGVDAADGADRADGDRGAGVGRGADGSRPGLRFPVAVTAEPFDLSFSGLKTAVRYHLEQHPPASRAERAAVAHAFQETVVESLTARTLAVLDRYPVQHVVVCGGVARNGRLKARLAERLATRRVTLTVPAGELCTDNGAMIGFVGSLLLRRGRRASLGLGAAASLAEVGWES